MDSAAVPQRDRAVGLWLMIVSVAIVGQVLLGGITRLTGSGLSITEWKPIVGAVPPLDEAAWAAEFQKYQQIPQYQQLNAHFALADFKRIYFWEWFHRLWGRLLGVAFLLPLAYFWRKRRLSGLGKPLLALLMLGLFQGFLGWFMVASGLKDLVYVSHLRLAVHFLAALVLLVAVFWVGAGQLVPPERRAGSAADGALARWLLGLLTLQLAYGAFMAGLKAAAAAPSWPTINGAWVPRGMLESAADLANDPVAVHFVHRNLAYLLLVLVLVFWVRLLRQPAPFALGWARHLPPLTVGAQVVLGVYTTLNAANAAVFVTLAALHQLTAVALLLSLVWVAFLAVRPAAAAATAADLSAPPPGANRSPA